MANILDKGRCSRNHHISGIKDVIVKRRPEGRATVYDCRECKNSRAREKAQANRPVSYKSLEVTRFISLSCGHETLFKSPLPRVASLVLCMRCRDYRKVLQWLDTLKERNGDEGREEDS